MNVTIPKETSAQRGGSTVGSGTLVRRLRSLRSMSTMVESGDAIVGATVDSLALRKQLSAEAENVSAEILALPDGAHHLHRATAACPACAGLGHAQSYELEPPRCTRCAGTGYRFRAPNAGPDCAVSPGERWGAYWKHPDGWMRLYPPTADQLAIAEMAKPDPTPWA